MKAADIISSVVRNGLCSGCGLCVSVLERGKAKMAMSPDGYLRPVVLAALTDAEGKVVTACCPGNRVEPVKVEAPIHPLWGPLLSVQTGFATNQEIRYAGSSGGVISGLACHLLAAGKVEFVAQIEMAEAKPLENQLRISRGIADVLVAAGSRYAPSAPLATLRDLLDQRQVFAVIGKPCDIAALRSYGQIDDRVGAQIPFMLSFFCAGVPSNKGALQIVDKLGMDPDRLKSFRYRGDGWPGKARAESVDGEVAEMDYSTSWGTILNQHLQFRCKICPDGTGEFSDVVCADAWYGKDGYPDFEERDGRSLVVARTAAGVRLLKDATAANSISLTDLPVSEIELMQPYQAHRKRMVLARVIGTALALKRWPTYWNMGLLRASLGARPMEWLRNMVGTFRRLRKGTA